MRGTAPERPRAGLRSLVTAAACLAAAAALAAGSATPEAAVRTFFEAMANNDSELAGTVVYDDAVLTGYRLQDGELLRSQTSARQFLQAMAQRDDELLERIWDVQVLQDDRLATVWTPYDFWLNGEFHHCGTNSFSLILDDDGGWRIAGVVYSSLVESCEPSPLGPPALD